MMSMHEEAVALALQVRNPFNNKRKVFFTSFSYVRSLT